MRNASLSAAGLPSTATCLSRDVAPDISRTFFFGTSSALASSSIRARLALPPSAGLRMRTFTTLRPSASVSMPSISSRPPRGVTRRLMAMPELDERQASTRSEDRRVDVIGDHPLDEHDDQDQDDGRDVEAAEIRQDRP